MPRLRGRTRSGGEAGTATVEFAVILPLFITLLFSVIEFGFMFRNQLVVQQAAREGARHAAIGRTTAEILTRTQASMANLPIDRLTVVQEYRTLSGTSWSSWMTLGNTATTPVANNAPQGAQVRVRLTYTHRLLTGPLFARIIGQPGATSTNLHSQMVMRRE